MINDLMGRLKAVSRIQFHVFGSVSLAAAGIILSLALKLSPWYYAMNVPVRVHMQAPAEARIDVCWDKTQIECLPLVPYLSIEKRVAEAGEIADLWLSELPPRPAYTVSLIFKTGVAKGIFQNLELDSRDVFLWGPIPGAGVQNTKLGMDELEANDITYTIQDGLYYFEGSPGSHLVATREIEPGPAFAGNGMTTLEIWSLLFSIYLLFAIPLYLLPFAVQNLGAAVNNDRPPRYPKWAYMLCGMAIFFMLLLAINSPVMLRQSDQMVYLNGAIRQDWLVYAARPPGYYMLVALVLWLSNYNLEGVVLLQAILLALSTTICIWALRRWLHPIVAVLVILGILFSPAQVHWALSIMRESLFADLVLLGVTAAIVHFTTPNKVAARICLAIFAVVCAAALFLRENGILLPVVLLPVLIPEAVKRLKSPGVIWKRMQSVFQLFVRYAGPVVATASVYIGLSIYNYLNYGYFQFTRHVTSHHYFWQEMATANFDSRSLLEPGPSMSEEAKTYLGERLYRSFILVREENLGLDAIYLAMFPTIHQIMIEKGQPVNWFHSAGIIDEIGRNASALVPWGADLTGVLRQYREFIVSNPADSRIKGYPLLPDDPTGLAYKQQLLSEIAGSIMYAGKPTQPHNIVDGYYRVTQAYTWYRPLFYLALLFSLYLLRYHNPVFLAPMTFFIANALLMIVLRTEQARYIESMDVLLILQAGLGLSRWTAGALRKIDSHDNVYRSAQLKQEK